ncbi:MAG: AIR synthase-related protein, partial [Candidatus Thorarchaeota archaeon]|nr:AIR synthase-related protein [Candidatus Thorarchaeota archaeon]
GDAIIGVASNGIHSNGFALARKIILSKYKVTDELPWGQTVAEELLRPTRIYVRHFKAMKEAGIDVRGIAHITGSGFKKILRLGAFKYKVDKLMEMPYIFPLMQKMGNVEWKEMFTTFNNGVGLVIVVPQKEKQQTLEVLRAHDIAWEMGIVEASEDPSVEIIPYGVNVS